MTNQEAIDILKCDISADKQGIEYCHDEVGIEALEMAIKALEQEPKILNTLDFAIDASNGDTNYFVGFRNGLRYAKSLIDGEEPQFESCTEQEPKEGHWINYYCAVTNERWYACSHCRSEVKSKTNTNYCPNCGTKMESEDKE